jgi:uncharacterized protein DUF3592
MRFVVSWSGGRTLLIALGGIFILVAVALVIYFASIFSQVMSYQAGQCTITGKQLLQQQEEQKETYSSNSTIHTRTTTTTVYQLDFQFMIQTTDGHRYTARGYDAFESASSDRAGQQAIVDQYTVGKTYPCWYNPARPAQAVLTRQFNWVLFIIPGVFLVVGGAFVIVGILNPFGLSYRRSFIAKTGNW